LKEVSTEGSSLGYWIPRRLSQKVAGAKNQEGILFLHLKEGRRQNPPRGLSVCGKLRRDSTSVCVRILYEECRSQENPLRVQG